VALLSILYRLKIQNHIMIEDKMIAKLRQRKGLTQLELAKAVGVSENTIANWEKGGASKWIDHLKTLCKVLNCDLDDLETDQKVEESIVFDLSPNMLQTIRKYCQAVIENDKKEVTKILSFADSYDRTLKFWLNEAHKLINKIDSRLTDKDKYDDIILTLSFNNLAIQLNKSLPNQVSLSKFRDLIESLELSYSVIDKYFFFKKTNFARNLIFQSSYLVIYAIGWEPNQISFLHHHGNSIDAILVIKGEMTHWLLTPEECKKYKVSFEGHDDSKKKYEGNFTTAREGDWVFIDRRHGHQIENLSNKRLFTLHIRFGAPPDDDNWINEKDSKEEPFIIRQLETYKLMPA
jgi:transcriptional regulator with XRE-family HTH domain/mannose-6-phosphate isomerase-like protein (cupin superfamily)